MNSIVSINKEEDTSKITKETKYINIPIDIVDNNINNYFIINGVDYSYSESINSKQGFIYADYNMFKQGELLIDSIIKDIPQNLSDIEKVRYIYITLGKELNIDINTLSSKNEILSLNNITNLNNIWGALSKKSITRSSIVKILLYICSKISIKSEVVSTDIKGNMANKIYINNTYIIVNLFEDIANIKAGFSTEHFDKYNNNIELDKKIKYINDNYTEYFLDKELKYINYNDDNLLLQILTITEKIININNIKPYELSIIYKKIFNKYFPNQKLKINNFYLRNNLEKEHFLVFDYNNFYYSYNYNKQKFIKLGYDYLIENIKNKKIGLYQNEEFNITRERMVL